MSSETQAFKNVMSRWASGISVITTAQGDDWRGFTANSLASVSISPLLISISIAKTLNTLDVVENSGVFAVNVLRRHQQEWGKIFAGMRPELENRFEDIDCTLDVNGCPILPDVMAYLSCRVHQKIDVGASFLFLGEVVAAYSTDNDDPLLYYNRSWGTFTHLD